GNQCVEGGDIFINIAAAVFRTTGTLARGPGMRDTQRQYEQKKERLLAEFRKALALGASVGLGKKTSNLFRSRQQAKYLIDVTHFNRVISIDEQGLIAEVEGM